MLPMGHRLQVITGILTVCELRPTGDRQPRRWARLPAGGPRLPAGGPPLSPLVE